MHIIIPARYDSTRLPGKLMMVIDGIPIIERVYRQALRANPVSIKIATDSQIIADHMIRIGAEVVMTAATHRSGTERIAEVIRQGSYPDDAILVNVQGDEPFIEPQLIQQVAEALHQDRGVMMSTLCWPIESLAQFHNPNTVKVVCDRQQHALYFSRSPIPLSRDNPDAYQHAFRHIGLYAYRVRFFQEMMQWSTCELEDDEGLEQLRVLWMGYPIRVDHACVRPLQDVNTMDDLVLARSQNRKA